MEMWGYSRGIPFENQNVDLKETQHSEQTYRVVTDKIRRQILHNSPRRDFTEAEVKICKETRNCAFLEIAK